jgi:hypothetical protein
MGGALYVEFISPVVVSHNTFVGNRVTTDNDPRRSDPHGAAIYSWGPASYFGSSLFVDNSGAEAFYSLAGSVEMSHNLFHDNPDGDYGGAPVWIHDEIHDDPLFFAPAAGDFRLRPGSPAIGAADPAPPEEARVDFADIGALPFDGDDPALLYVVPHRARRPAGGRLELRVLLANLGPDPIRAPLRAQLTGDGREEPWWSEERMLRIGAEHTWSGKVDLPIPAALPPGSYRLQLRWEDETEVIRLQVVPSVSAVRARLAAEAGTRHSPPPATRPSPG